ncbi:MAG: class I SAM-dependent methyltransferase [Bryobacteraceae bacterium]
MPEHFQPVPVTSPAANPALFALRCFFDLHLAAIARFLRKRLASVSGTVLDVGAGESPWREWLPPGTQYFGVDVATAGHFGMRRNAAVVFYDGERLPFPDRSFDNVLCVEVLEHIQAPAVFMAEIARVLRPGGALILTIPWSARRHHIPYDFQRFTREGLACLLEAGGFVDVQIEERGTDVGVIANKLLVLCLRLLRPARLYQGIWSIPVALLCLPVTIVFLCAAHLSDRLGSSADEDPLGYAVSARRA